MKTAIVYYSKHHGNTKKLLGAIAEQAEVTLVDVLNAENIDSAVKFYKEISKGE